MPLLTVTASTYTALCSGCAQTSTAALSAIVQVPDPAAPGGVGLNLVCPNCGAEEDLNTAFSAADALAGPDAHEQQVSLIRQLQQQLGL